MAGFFVSFLHSRVIKVAILVTHIGVDKFVFLKNMAYQTQCNGCLPSFGDFCVGDLG